MHRAIAIVSLMWLLAPAAARGDDLSLSPRLRDLIDHGRFVETPVGFRMLALSFLADGCAAIGERDATQRASARRCVEAAHRQATALRKQHPQRARDGLWQSHHNLILGAAHRVGDCLDEALHQQLSELLHRRSLADPTAHAASFDKRPQRWPADQAATLASLVRYDRAHQKTLAPDAITRWRTYVLAHAFDARRGLPHSEATGTAARAAIPRGCALTFETIYLYEVDDALARTWWAKTKEHYFVARGIPSGFREWPAGVDGPSDVDSGPIVMGIGAAATAFGLVAARVMGDAPIAEQLASTMALGDLATRTSPRLARAANTTLADAIRFLAAHVTTSR